MGGTPGVLVGGDTRGHPRGQPWGHRGDSGPRGAEAGERALTQDGGDAGRPCPHPRWRPLPAPYILLVPSLKMAAARLASRRRWGGAGRAEAQAEAAPPAAPGLVPSRPGTMDCYTANWNPLGEEAFYR